ncbi:MAG: hypothetical protein A2015_02730 [Spirochaetes bacterium GWF1_31_7]|nr:MAG: hypothetical protein A2Y30_15775 [Spirochaetes bacterium GWE1_32_154]OHD47104.1 MAG: hypothetical protein A2015_02730 [Spirochaetes bacterium GWF1_31_7]OHD51995.1 MAG: hypothetical protein A2Y29_14860 [Spirochaetes bacterium GWE2_31_10]HBI38291.1 YafY family transcriptional regulator [Spirochaetia bacterium]
MRIDRMLSIVVILLNRDRVSAKELALKFEVNTRTIYRDIDAINMAGIPVVSYQGNNGGFGLVANYRLDAQYISVNDMKTIITTLKSINSTLHDISIETLIAKIENLIPLNGGYQSVPETAIIDILPWGVQEKVKNYIKDINNAITKSTLIEIEYASLRSEESVRIIEPMTLILKGTAWYIFAFCRLKSDYRLFKLSRIRTISITDTHFSRKVMSYYDFSSQYESTQPSMVTLLLQFHESQKNMMEEYCNENDIMTIKDGFYTVNVSLPDDYWVLSWLLSMGDTVEVLQPLHIRDKLCESAKNILKKYQT